MPDRPRVFDPESRTTDLVGRPRATLRDAYHLLLSAPWWVDLAVIAGAFLAVNLVFAGLYLAVGGIALARPASFADAFFVSVQTLATIGYAATTSPTLPSGWCCCGPSRAPRARPCTGCAT
ncbi:MAG: hypothetical protein ACXWK6_13590 [Myxococcaceae bacterium]